MDNILLWIRKSVYQLVSLRQGCTTFEYYLFGITTFRKSTKYGRDVVILLYQLDRDGELLRSGMKQVSEIFFFQMQLFGYCMFHCFFASDGESPILNCVSGLSD